MRLTSIGFSVACLALVGCPKDPAGNNNTVDADVPTPRCGDENVDTGEQCDEGAANSDSQPDACRSDCRSAFCGDSVKDSSEICDTTVGSATCAARAAD